MNKEVIRKRLREDNFTGLKYFVCRNETTGYFADELPIELETSKGLFAFDLETYKCIDIFKSNLKRLLHEHKLWLKDNSKGKRLDLSNMNLRNAKLKGSNMKSAILTDVDLYGANLTFANLTFANLTGANLTGTNLTGTNLTGTNLTGTNLKFADLKFTNLTDTNLTGANLDYMNLTSLLSFFKSNLR